jgi:hypothetical protein
MKPYESQTTDLRFLRGNLDSSRRDPFLAADEHSCVFLRTSTSVNRPASIALGALWGLSARRRMEDRGEIDGYC